MVSGERILSLVQAPSLWEGWGGLLFVYRIIYPHIPCRRIAYPPERKGNTACARACSLSKQSGERRANNQSAQGTALGICLYVSVAPQGQKNEKQLPLPTAFLSGLYSFAPSGRFYCCTFVRRAMPWADVSLPLRGVGSLMFRRICYPPVLSMRISNPYIRCCRIQNPAEHYRKGQGARG